MKYAVVSTGSKQYKVAVGDVVEIDHLNKEVNSDYIFPKTLLLVNDQKRFVGKPFLGDISVKGKIMGHRKTEKVRVAKFKAKSRYRRVTGHRDLVTKVKIEEIREK